MENQREKYIVYLLVGLSLYACVDYFRDNSQDMHLTQESLSYQSEICTNVNQNDLIYNADAAVTMQKQIDKLNGNSNLGDVISKKTTAEDYIRGLLPVVVPLFVMFFLALLCFIGSCVQCCGRIVCRCTCCSRNFIDNPYSKLSIYVCSILSITMLVAIMGTSIAGVILTKNMGQSYDQMSCTIISSLNDLSYGKPSSQWVGVNGLSDQLNQILGNLTESQNDFQTFTQSPVNIVQVSTTINNTYESLNGRTVPNPIVGGTPAQVQPSLITMLGPPTDDTTITGSLTQEYNTVTVEINNNLIEFANSVTTINQNFPSITSSLQTGADKTANFTVKIDNLSDNTTKILQESFNNPKFGFNVVILIIFGVLMLFSIIGIISIVLMLSLRIPHFKFVIYLTWIFISVFTIIGFFFSAIMFVTSIVSVEACDVFNQSINNQTAYQQYVGNYVGTTFQSDTEVCLFGDGDLATEFGFNDILQDLNQMSTSLDELNNYQSTITTQPQLANYWLNAVVFQEQDPASITQVEAYNSIITLLQMLQQIETYPVPPSTTQVVTALASCNQWSDYNSPQQQQFSQGGCKVLQDQLMFNYTHCQQLETQVLISEPTTAIGSQVSASIFQLFYQVCVDIFNNAFITQRLNAVDFTSCNVNPSVKTQYTNCYQQLVTYDSSLQSVLAQLGAQLALIQQENNNVYAQFDLKLQQIQQFSDPIDGVLNMIGNPQTGLANNLNCTFFKQDLQDVNLSLCQSFLIDIYIVTITLIVISSFGCCAMLGLFFSTTRLKFWTEAVLEELQNMRMDDPQNNAITNRSITSGYPDELELVQK